MYKKWHILSITLIAATVPTYTQPEIENNVHFELWYSILMYTYKD